ncbi:MAG: hypothetical protein JST92_01615, partial [Deltaproteobacteria bacterium]|nr:hypothetical protein [Deltaproteobacteria bacterium]
NSTLAWNSAPQGSEVASINSVLNVTSSVLRGSCARAIAGHFGTVLSGGANFVTDGGDCALASSGDTVGTSSAPADPKLRPFDAYGGLTSTLLPFRVGPLRHAGLCTDATDQRGVPVPSTGCDIGSTQLEASLDVEVPCDATALTAALRHAAIADKSTLHLQAGCTYTLAEPCTPKTAAARCQWQDLGFFMGPNGLPLIQSDVTIEGNGATIARSNEPGIAPFRLFTVAGPFTEVARQHFDPQAASPGYPEPGALTLHQVRLSNGLARGGRGGDADFTGIREGRGGGGGAGMGGCLFVAGAATLDGSTLDGCVAEGGAAGTTRSATGDWFCGGGGLGGNAGLCDFGVGGGGGFMGNGGGGGGGAAGDGSGVNGHAWGGGATSDALIGRTGGSALGEPWGSGGDGVTNAGVGGGGGDREGVQSFLIGQEGGFGGGGGGGSGAFPGGAGGFGGGAGGSGTGLGASAGGFGGGGNPAGFGGGGLQTPGQGLGGAIFVVGDLQVRRSTLSGNIARAPSGNIGIGGAVFAFSQTPRNGGPIPGASVRITSSTLDGNLADQAGTLALWDNSAAAVSSTAIGGASACGLSGSGALTSAGANFVADGTPSNGLTACAFTATGDTAGTSTPLDPGLGALGNNGGLTPTQSPADTSPLLAHGTCTDSVDQRGAKLLSAPACDIGSVERTRIGVTITLAGTGSGTVTSGPAAISCPPTCSSAPALSETMTLTASPTTGATFDGFSGDCSGATCVLATAGAFHVTATFTSGILIDAGSPDAGADAGAPDAGDADAGAQDSGTDAGAPDAGADAGLADAGADAGSPDAGATDAGTSDAGAHDAGSSGGAVSSSGCGCSNSGSPNQAVLTVLGLLAFARRRRRSLT